jgi:hypothetical protein
MQTLTTKHHRLAALRPLSPESVASVAAAWWIQDGTNGCYKTYAVRVVGSNQALQISSTDH